MSQYIMSSQQQNKTSLKKHEKALSDYYFNPTKPGAYYGPSKLRDELKANRPPDVKLRKVKRFVKNQDAYSLHKPVRHKFQRMRVRVNVVNEMFDLDLADLSRYSKENEGVRYLLVAIDILSRFAFVFPLSNKKPESVLTAFKQILKQQRPRKVRVDGGSEFKGVFKSFLQKQKIKLTIARNENIKSNYVERFNRTLKSLITRYMTHNNTKRYLDALPDLVYNYNHTLHSSLPKLSPARVDKTNEVKVWNHIYLEPLRKVIKPKIKKYLFKVGDLVRISYLRKPFSKELDLKWMEELFKVARRYRKQGFPQYKLKDFHDEPLIGSFYTNELQKVSKAADVLWQVEKVLKRKKVKGKKYALVRWVGWPKSFDSYVEERELKEV
ncbi:uncharacterized protein LOC124271717 [Haliotis rubra]|uniref:uncharacterized protein LOC124271717 n=1 Tax=Haliotis rubra TaxID=36100 RepID=UPI001EE62F05|nr:uncharacterized protein LOC124271717 [Haliotis rubra]